MDHSLLRGTGKRKLKLLGIVLIGATLASQSALANTIDVTYSGSADFGSGGVGYKSGKIAPNPTYPTGSTLVGVGIGGDSFTSTDHTYDFSATGQFNTWCVDIYHWLVGGPVTYTVGTGSDLEYELTNATVIAQRRPNASTRVDQLVQLANEVYSSVDTRKESAAFQLAVWAITFGTADGSGHYSINTIDSDFKVDSATVTRPPGVLANTWLANLDTASNTGNYKLTYLSANGTQDMVVFTPVTEPATLALLGLGLAGFGFSRRKRAS